MGSKDRVAFSQTVVKFSPSSLTRTSTSWVRAPQIWRGFSRIRAPVISVGCSMSMVTSLGYASAAPSQ